MALVHSSTTFLRSSVPSGPQSYVPANPPYISEPGNTKPLLLQSDIIFSNLFNSCIILFPYFIIAPLGLRVMLNLMVKAGISTEIFSSVNASRFPNGLVYQNWRFSRLGKIGRERNLKRNFFGRHYYARSGRHFSGIPNKRRFFFVKPQIRIFGAYQTLLADIWRQKKRLF